MTIRYLMYFAGVSLLLSACTSTKYVSTSEYDDVYYSSSDKTTVVVREEQRNTQNREPYTSDRTYERNREIYEDPSLAYDEDDFYFSRRVRRFHQSNFGSWRYYDPFFSNDLYFVMGTPAWNNWYNRGWYSWNRPRFGANWGFRGGFGFGGFNDPFMGFNDPWAFNSFNYYNPWVNSYYGFDPFWGYGVGGGWGWNSWNRPFGWNNYSYFYCPPVATGNFRTDYNTSRRTLAQRNSARTAVGSQTSYSARSRNNGNVVRQPSTVNTGNVRNSRNSQLASVRNSTDYLRPRTDLERRESSPRVRTSSRQPNSVRRTNSNSRVNT